MREAKSWKHGSAKAFAASSGSEAGRASREARRHIAAASASSREEATFWAQRSMPAKAHPAQSMWMDAGEPGMPSEARRSPSSAKASRVSWTKSPWA